MNQRGLREVCEVFNRRKVDYVVVGAQAGALHGHVRATEDIDLLIRNTKDNVSRAVEALAELFPDISREIHPQDILEHVVLKVADDIEVDVSISAWSVDFESAEDDIESIDIGGTRIPYLGLRSLIKSKSTSREIDQWDVRVLSEILRARDKK